MSETPTSSEGSDADEAVNSPDDAPAEGMTPKELRAYLKRICGGPITPEALQRAGWDVGPLTPERMKQAGFETGRVYESTGRMLAAFAATATTHAHRHPDDPEAQGMAAIFTAMEHAHRHPDDDDPEAQRFRDKVGKWSARGVKHSSGLVRSAREYVSTTREQQANMLCNAVAHGLQRDWNALEIAKRLVMLLGSLPDIAKHRRAPASPGGWQGTDAEAKAVSAVERAIEEMLDDEDAKTITKAALVALGCPKKTAHNIYR